MSEATGRSAAFFTHISKRICDAVGDSAGAQAEAAYAVQRALGLKHDLQTSLRRCIAQLEPGRYRTHRSLGERRGDRTLSCAYGDMMVCGPPVRGILVARDVTPCAVSAASAVENLRLVQFGFSFIFEPVALSPL